MKYALKNPQDGQIAGESLSWRAIPDSSYAEIDEVLLDNPPPEGWVWDGGLRPPTEEELETKRKEQATREKAQEVFASAARKPPEQIVQEAQGDYSQISQEEMYALIMAVILWIVDRITRSAMPLTPLDQAMLQHLSKYRTKRTEVWTKARDPDVTAQEIEDIDPSV